MIYSPAEDSYMLEKEIKKYLSSLNIKDKKEIKVLDMGSGSGIQALACIKAGVPRENILAADINPEAIRELKKQKLKAIQSNLFNKIKKKDKFDLIVFNAPYLPTHKYDKEPDTTAGKRGNEIIIKFLKQAKQHLADKGIILLLFSSLSKPKEILRSAEKLGYNAEKLVEQNVGMMEKLFVWKFHA